ncbi:spermidine synthase [Leifsonia flava]|uniref:SAM-dependent methyltransferase n=1 Tax=Orlajensenia leifsoniae TaxID=2561933 RepID=A0A4Y9R9C3_9MICO|nr:fused MFS/spermidine synthase [Leifsonia flava]TFW00134.1 SAM-dependent methyltransferase [Leifsonia flava]
MDQRMRLDEDPFVPGSFILSVDGIRQSHVDPADPTRLFFEYTRRIGHVIDLVADPGQPIRALHLGGGALTLARYVAATRPDSEQVVVEIDREQTDFVLERMPLADASGITIVFSDARQALARLEEDGEIAFDVIVVDIYLALESPEYVGLRGFFDEVAPLLALGGAIVVNVADGRSQIQTRAQRLELGRVVEATLATAPPRVLAGEELGNIVLVGADADRIAEWAPELQQRGPHPAAVDLG